MGKKHYNLIFEGKLVAGFDKKTLLENLSRMYKKDQAVLEKKFFVGKPVIILKTEDRDKAKRLLKDLRGAGAESTIKEILEIPAAPRQEPVQDKKPATDTTPPSSQSSRKKRRWPLWAAVIVVVLCILAGGAYWYATTKLLDMSVPEAVLEGEKALASENLIALGHANISKAIELEKLFLGDDDPDALAPSNDDTLLGKLIASGLKPRKHLHHVLLALHLGANDNGHYSLILIGDFPRDAVLKFLNSEYDVEKSQIKKESVYIFSKQNVEDCSFSPKRVIHITRNRILITSPDYMETLLNNLEASPSRTVDLDPWRRYRSKHIASLALFAPQHTEKAADGIVAMILKGLKEKIAPIHSGFAGVSAQLIPPGLNIDLLLNSKDRNWISAKSEGWRKMIKEKQEAAGKEFPTLAKLFNYLSISNNEEQLKVEVTLNRELSQNMNDIVGELIGSIFSFGGGSSPSGQAQVSKEKLEKNPIPFFANYPVSKLKPFNTKLDSFFAPALTVGPFGVGIKGVRINDNGEIEITLEAQGREIENLGKASKRATLTVTSAKDKNGRVLLKDESCGRDRNLKPAELSSLMDGIYFRGSQMMNYRKIEGKKTLRLKQGVALNDLNSLEGVIRLNLPVQTEAEIIKAPFADQVVERSNFRLRFNKAPANRLSFSFSGDESLLIAVRGLNKNKKKLASSGGSSAKRLFSQGKSVTQDYHGTVEYAQIILAKGIKELSYPFSISNPRPRYKDKNVRIPQKVETYSLKRFDAKFARSRPKKNKEKGWMGKPDFSLDLPPFAMDIYQLNVSKGWGVTGTLQLFTPSIPSLADNLTAVEIRLTEAVTDKNESVPIEYSNFILLSRSGYYMNGVFKPDPKKPYLEGQLHIRFPFDKETISNLKGKLVLRLPNRTEIIQLNRFDVGSKFSSNGYNLHVKEITHDGAKMTIKGDQNRIIGFRVFNKENELVNGPSRTLEYKEKMWFADLRYTGIPDRIDMIVAKQMESREFPFSLTINQKKD